MEQFFAGLALGILASWLSGLPKFIWNQPAAAAELHRIAEISFPFIATVLLLIYAYLSRRVVAGSMDWLAVSAWVLVFAPLALGVLVALIKRLKAVQSAASEKPPE